MAKFPKQPVDSLQLDEIVIIQTKISTDQKIQHINGECVHTFYLSIDILSGVGEDALKCYLLFKGFFGQFEGSRFDCYTEINQLDERKIDMLFPSKEGSLLLENIHG